MNTHDDRSCPVAARRTTLPLSGLLLFAGPTYAQTHLGSELRGTYVRPYKAVLPGMAATLSLGIGKMAHWRSEVYWHLPRVSRVAYAIGPRQLAAASDTTSRTVSGTAREGLMGFATGLQGLFGGRNKTHGTFWEVMLAFDDLTYWSETTIRYTHSDEVRHGRGTDHRTMLSLRVGAGHRLPVGPGQLRFVLTAAPLALEFYKHGGSRRQTFPFFGLGAAYQWRLGA